MGAWIKANGVFDDRRTNADYRKKWGRQSGQDPMRAVEVEDRLRGCQ